METNYVFYKLRKIFGYNEEQLMDLFKSVDYIVSPIDMFAWMKQDIYPGFKEMPDEALAALLNAFIIEKRGKKDDQIPVPETKLNNNIIFRKFRIALALKDEDIVNLLGSVDMRIGKAELNAFFRDSKHPHYRICGDQFLRNFLRGLQLKHLKQG